MWRNRGLDHRSCQYSTLQAFEYQQRIGSEAEKALSLTNQLSQQNEEWAELINSADQALRVLGDFETYFEVLQQDLSSLTDSLQRLGPSGPVAAPPPARAT